MQQYSITILDSTALPFTAILHNIPKVDRKIDWWIECDKNENREFYWKREGEKERKNNNLIIPVSNVVIRFERKNWNEEVYFIFLTLSLCVCLSISLSEVILSMTALFSNNNFYILPIPIFTLIYSFHHPDFCLSNRLLTVHLIS